MGEITMTFSSLRRTAFTAVAVLLAMTGAASAHHLMGGKMPSTFGEGLLSGLGHPVIGPDHLAFLIAVGIAVGVGGLSLALPIVFVAAVESLLCSRMADRLADNRGLSYHPNKELWGQGLVNIIAPLLNGFPHTGALARTATNIKVGAISPLAGVAKCFLKLGIALYMATWLELVPMACIGGILLYVATAMVKPAEVRQVLQHNGFHIALMGYTAVMVIMTDFLTGVLSAIIIWGVGTRFFDKPVPVVETAGATQG